MKKVSDAWRNGQIAAEIDRCKVSSAPQFKIGDKVRNKYNNEVGVVDRVSLGRELHDCVLVRFNNQGDGYTMLKTQLERVE